MARRAFFSFHYKNDVQRGYVVKNSQVLKGREETGFFDSSAFEKAKNEDPESLKRFLREEIKGSSVLCVLVGEETAHRRWVQFEILQALWDGRGLLGVRVHNIQDWNGNESDEGTNPFDLLGVHTKDDNVRLIKRKSISDEWTYTSDFGERVLSEWPYTSVLPATGSIPLSRFFKLYSWTSRSHNEIGDWLDRAAVQAGR